MKNVAIVGASGFIGGHLTTRYKSVRKFRRDNIFDLKNDDSELTIIAAAPAEKWKANANPIEDLINIKKLIESLKCLEERKCVLISTVDVYPVGLKFDEDAPLPIDHPEPYGANRGFLERSLLEIIQDLHILRLPGMYGPGLKKNLIFDLLNGTVPPKLNLLSSFQFYDVRMLPYHIERVLNINIPALNLATEPILVDEIYKHCFDASGKDFEVASIHYGMETKFALQVAGREGRYLYSKIEILSGIRQWVKESQK